MSLHALAQRMSLSQTTEPCSPLLATVSNDYATHKGYVDLVAYAARRAGVEPLGDRPPEGRDSLQPGGDAPRRPQGQTCSS